MLLLRAICAVTTAVTMGLMMSGCGVLSDSSSESDAEKESITSSAVETDNAEDILSQIENEYLDAKAFYGDDVFASNCNKLYGVDIDRVYDGGILYASGGGYADEVSMLKPADGVSAEQILNERLELRKNTFANYNPEESGKLDKAEIFEAGDYWVLVISDNAEDISKTIKELAE